MEQTTKILSERLGLRLSQVNKVIELLEDGATVPFIARYRKEATSGLDEVAIFSIESEYKRLSEIKARKKYILEAIKSQGKLTDKIQELIEDSWQETEIEDIYLPYKQKRHTRAAIAREAGLEEYAQMIMNSGGYGSIEKKAAKFTNSKVPTEDAVISGALDIVAEMISENNTARNTVRDEFARRAEITSRVIKGKEEEGQKYRDYFNTTIRLGSCPSHTLLAIRRGEAEKILRVSIDIKKENVFHKLERLFIRPKADRPELLQRAIKDSYNRLLAPSIENETAIASKKKADTEAIKVFADNLRQVLLAAPLGQKRTMGIDPGFRTGCKVVCLDNCGNLLHNDTIYPHPPVNDVKTAIQKLVSLTDKYGIEAIAVGNGTAGRETEQFLRSIKFNRKIDIFPVSENGASIYSASALAREEFPDYDVTVRGAVSIARRLMDPLAELIKIDPKSIGVGQYQHDVDQTLLRQSLEQTVLSCVNTVGVEVNSASVQLLTYISGIGPKTAQNIIDYRKDNGPFHYRKELLKVPGLGAKTYEQCAGFIRVAISDNPLDNTGVHPEHYGIANKMACDLKVDVKELISSKELRSQINPENYINPQKNIGIQTVNDILSEMDKAGRDPRSTIETVAFDPAIRTIEDLEPGMIVNGTVTNITNFGAFVNIGIKENALLHVTQISDRRLSSPAEVLHINQNIKVKILDIDRDRKRIQLTLKYV